MSIWTLISSAPERLARTAAEAACRECRPGRIVFGGWVTGETPRHYLVQVFLGDAPEETWRERVVFEVPKHAGSPRLVVDATREAAPHEEAMGRPSVPPLKKLSGTERS
jgi:hypothetical protein